MSAGTDGMSFSPPGHPSGHPSGHQSKCWLGSLLLDIHDHKKKTAVAHPWHHPVYKELNYACIIKWSWSGEEKIEKITIIFWSDHDQFTIMKKVI